MKTSSLAPFASIAALVLASCGGGSGGGGGTAGLATVNLLVADAPSDSLSAFEVTITGLFLSNASGESPNLLPTARTVNLIDLATRSALLEVAAAAPGAYDGARLAFDAASLMARDLGGAVVAVTSTGSGALATIAPPVSIGAGDRRKVHFDLPLATTLADDPLVPGALVWTPLLVVTDRRGVNEPLDELHGIVRSESPATHVLVIDLVEREDASRHGTLPIVLQPSSVLLDDDGNPFSDEAAFFAFARAGDRVEASGALADDGRFLADLVHVERDAGGGEDVARIRGTLTAIDTAADRLTLRLRTIDFGRSVVEPVLDALGDPAEIEVDTTGAEFRLRGADPRSGTENDLVVGQGLKVDFLAFATAPFPARQVEVEDERAEFEGTIVDVGGLPGSFVVHLEHHDPAVLAGLVASSSTDVDVLLDGSERLWLKVDGEPAIAAADLLPGLRVRVRGDLSGPADAPQIEAADARVNTGRLRGRVTGIDRAAATFVVDVDRIDDPFGGASLPDPVTIRVEDVAEIEGDARNESGFFDLFEELGGGDVLEVELNGLADGLGGARAYVIDAKVDD